MPEQLQEIRQAEDASKNYTLQCILDETPNQCLLLLEFFDMPIWVPTGNIQKTKEYIDFKKRKEEIQKEKTKKRKRSQ